MSINAPAGPGIRLHHLTMVAEADGVMVGRPDIGSYALFPAEGAQALRMLDAGTPVAQTAAWYEQESGETLDVDDFLDTLTELGFVCRAGEERRELGPVRWMRLGRWLFSWPAGVAALALAAAAAAVMIREPALRPSYHRLFFTEYLSLIPVALTAAQVPCILIHEGSHALAGRRLGLPSTLRLGRRLYYLVAETRLDALLSVPRRKRYLPFLAGMLADAVLIAVLTLAAAGLRTPGVPAWIPGLCLAVAFTCVLRLLWQFLFYLQTDLYFVLSHAMGCADLQNAARFQVMTQVRRLLRRAPRAPGAEWSDRDRLMARWYAPLFVVGYAFSLGSLAWAGIPSTVHFWSLILARFHGGQAPVTGILDALSFIVLSSLQWGLLAYVAIRDRRARSRRGSPQTTSEGALT
jgi:hypothetical protein